MTRIYNVDIYGYNESIKASAYPMLASMPEDGYVKSELSSRDKIRASKLGNASCGSGHDNYLKGIIVQFDIEYTQYFTPQLQRYSFLDIVSSMSKMHRITQMDLDESCNKYVLTSVKFLLKELINVYTEAVENKAKKIFLYHPHGGDMICSYSFDEEKEAEKFDVEELTIYQLYMKIISNCPMGLKLVMRVSTNALQLKTIYNQRRHHKLKEDWGPMCDWIETLPFADYIIKKED